VITKRDNGVFVEWSARIDIARRFPFGEEIQYIRGEKAPLTPSEEFQKRNEEPIPAESFQHMDGRKY
jgi:hypothetical protein